MPSLLLGALVVTLAVQLVLALFLVRAMRRVRTLDERVRQLGEGLSLLSETAESGFKAVASEVERLQHTGSRRAAAQVTNARLVNALRRGRSVQEIAASEKISEGEVNLRLHLAEQAKPEPPAALAVALAPAPEPERKTTRVRAPRSRTNGSLRS